MNLHNFLLEYTTPNQKIILNDKNNNNILEPQQFIYSLELIHNLETLINKNDTLIANTKIMEIKTSIILNEEERTPTKNDVLIIKIDIE